MDGNIIITIMRLVKSLLFQMIHCVIYEKFYITVEEATVSCLEHMMKFNCSGIMCILVISYWLLQHRRQKIQSNSLDSFVDYVFDDFC